MALKYFLNGFSDVATELVGFFEKIIQKQQSQKISKLFYTVYKYQLTYNILLLAGDVQGS